MTDKVQKTLEEVDNYEQSVHATLTTLHIYKYDDDSRQIDPNIKSWFGKKMKPGDITPDLLIQLNANRGIVVELKRSLPKNDESRDLWQTEFEQLKRYDCDMTGWETANKKITEQDLILLTSQKLGMIVSDYIDENNLTFNDFSKNFAVLEFNPASGIKHAIFLRKIKGNITDFKKITNDKLRNGITVALEYLLMSGLSKVKFVDTKPNIVYLMAVMWDFIFSSIPNEEDWRNARESKGGKIVEILVEIDDLRDKVNQNFTINSDNSVVKSEWIKEALENFVKIKLAKKNGSSYTIKYRKKIKDEGENENKHRVFAELLYKEGIQTLLDNK